MRTISDTKPTTSLGECREKVSRCATCQLKKEGISLHKFNSLYTLAELPLVLLMSNCRKLKSDRLPQPVWGQCVRSVCMYLPLSRKSSAFLFIRHYTLFFFLIWLTRLTQRKVWLEFSSDIFYFSCKHPLLVWLNRLLLFIWEADIAHTYFQYTQHWKIQSRKEKLIKKEDKAWLWKHLRSLRKRKPPMQLYLSKWTM